MFRPAVEVILLFLQSNKTLFVCVEERKFVSLYKRQKRARQIGSFSKVMLWETNYYGKCLFLMRAMVVKCCTCRKSVCVCVCVCVCMCIVENHSFFSLSCTRECCFRELRFTQRVVRYWISWFSAKSSFCLNIHQVIYIKWNTLEVARVNFCNLCASCQCALWALRSAVFQQN